MSAINCNKTTRLGKKLFFVAYSFILIKCLIAYSTFQVFVPIDSMIYKTIFKFIPYLLVLYKVVTQDKFANKSIVLYACFAVLSLAIYFFASDGLMLDAAFLILGSHGINLKNIVNCYFIIALFITALFFLLSIGGFIINYVAYTEGGIPRYAFGNVYATDFAARIFYLEIAYTYLRKRKCTFLYFVFWLMIGILVYYFCRARLDTLLIILFAFAMLLYAKFPKVFKKKTVKVILSYSMAFFCALAILLHFIYTDDSAVLTRLNELLSGRLGLGREGIDKYGFTLFGQPVPMNGNGFSPEGVDLSKEYFFIDCGFLKLGLCDGLIYLLVVVVCYISTAKSSVKNGDNKLALIIFFLALTSVVDHHIIEIAYNPFIFVVSAAICKERSKSGKPVCNSALTKKEIPA